jgi:hypothetical protein
LRVGTQLDQTLGIFANRLDVLPCNADRDKVDERFFRFGVGGKDALVDFGRFIEAPR